MEKRGLKYLVILFFIIVFIPVITAQLESGVCVEAEIVDISPSSVEIGEEFTVGIHIENCGDQLPENVVFEIITLPVDISVKEPLSIEVSQIRYANSERFINYHMKISDQAQSGTYIIETRLSYSNRQKDYDIEVNVIGNEAELGIASVKVDPILPYEKETVELTLRIENFGDGDANSVRINVDHAFKGVRESFIGTLDSGEDGPAVFNFITDEYGEFTLPIKINYQDDFGSHETNTEITLTILKKKTNWLAIIGFLVLAGVVVYGLLHYSKVKRTKNRIIHQLLKEGEINGANLDRAKKENAKKTERERRSRERKEEKRKKRIKEFKKEVLKKLKK
jgi:hypothetical protein